MVNTKKPTGNPSCLLIIRRAKRIARDILAKASVVSVGDELSKEEKRGGIGTSWQDTDVGWVEEGANVDTSLGARKPLEKAVVRVVRAAKGEDDVAEYMGQMARSISSFFLT